MKLAVRNQKEFAAGLIFLAIGVYSALFSLKYPLGNASNMGPGYFPFAVSLILVALGLASVFRSIKWTHQEKLEPWRLVPLLFILCGVAVFALLISVSGLILASLSLVFISSYKSVFSTPIRVAVLAIGTTAFVVIIFIYLLHLGIRL